MDTLNDMCKRYWWIVGALGFMLVFSTRLQAMWNSPEQMDRMQASVEKLSDSLELYTAKQEVANEKRDQLINILISKRIGERYENDARSSGAVGDVDAVRLPSDTRTIHEELEGADTLEMTNVDTEGI